MTLRSPTISPDWRHPAILERAVDQDLPIRLRDGASVVTPSSGIGTVYKQVADPASLPTPVYSGAVVAGATSLLSVPAVAASEPLSSDWSATWVMEPVTGGPTCTFRQRVFLVGYLPYPRVAEEDLLRIVPEIRLPARRPNQADWSPQIGEAWYQVLRYLTGSGQKPWAAIDGSDLYEWHLREALALCCGAIPGDESGFFARKAAEFRSEALLARSTCRIEYEETPLVRTATRGSVIPCAPAGRPWC